RLERTLENKHKKRKYKLIVHIMLIIVMILICSLSIIEVDKNIVSMLDDNKNYYISNFFMNFKDSCIQSYNEVYNKSKELLK
ncbi:MAG TPA: hypothetical protein VLM81_01645, partial [Peptostreptococcaceae bacterium]|nr:hypothetical protein [Peptostreptococcaceae bacterium]